MAFKIDLSNTYSYPVAVDIMGDKGKTKTFTFNTEFKRFSQTEAEQLSKDLQSFDGEAAKLSDDDFIDEVVANWSDITDEADQPLDFNNAIHKAAVLDVYGVKQAIIKAFFESISGAKRKN